MLESFEKSKRQNCNDCLWYDHKMRKCTKHGDVPVEFRTNNDCGDFEDDIPF